LKSKRRLLKGEKLLVDTSFLLPALGIRVEREVMEAIKCFHLFTICYLEVGVLEAMWCVMKLVPHNKLDIVERGIEAIRDSYELITPPSRAFIDAFKLYLSGHRDYIDNLMYATSRVLGIRFLTIDERFIDFLSSHGFPIDNIVSPRELA